MEDNQSFRSLIPVDANGMDEIADELAQPKPKQTPEVQAKSAEEEAKQLKKEIDEKAKRLAKIQPKKISAGAKVGIGFLALGAVAVGFGIYRIVDECFDHHTFTDKCMEVEETKGFWGEDVRYKFCIDEDRIRYGYKEITLLGWFNNYTMVDIGGNELPVDKVITGGKEYTPQTAPDGMFIEANRLWNEYMDFWRDDVNKITNLIGEVKNSISDEWERWRNSRISEQEVEQIYKDAKQGSGQQPEQIPVVPEQQEAEEELALPVEPEQPTPPLACLRVEREAEGIGRLELSFCADGMISIYNLQDDYKIIDSDGNGEIDRVISEDSSWSRDRGAASMFDSAQENWKKYWEAGRLGIVYEQYKPELEVLVQQYSMEEPSNGAGAE